MPLQISFLLRPRRSHQFLFFFGFAQLSKTFLFRLLAVALLLF
jgi:hypothetical protein